jgi:uncharacterized membrane protein
MEKQELLRHVKEMATQGLTKEELLAAYAGIPEKVEHRKVGISEILYVIGGAIVVLGICILVGQNWNTLSIVSKILATFGSGVAAYLVGVLFMRHEKFQTMAQAFFLISGLVLPLGLGVIFDNAGYDVSSSGVQSLITLIFFRCLAHPTGS